MDGIPVLRYRHKATKANPNGNEQCLHCNYHYASTIIGHKAGQGDKGFQSFSFNVEAHFVDPLAANWAKRACGGSQIYS